MIDVVGISFKENGHVYYFSPNNLVLSENTHVIVKTEHGIQYAYVRKSNFKLNDNQLVTPLKSIMRIADREDLKKHTKNIKDAKLALNEARKISEKLNMKIYLIDSMYTLDRDKLLFRFLSDTRVDFRELAKELANKYKTRIELRQIGARDKAKEIGGIGVCGGELCCLRFLKKIDTISMNMAKDQNLALNPSKINGACGRLLCCLAYEDEIYIEAAKKLPNVGETIKTKNGEALVVSVDIINHRGKIMLNGEKVDYDFESEE